MNMFQVLFYGAVAFLAAVAVFMGAVMMITSLQNGAVMLSYSSDGKMVAETVTRAGDAGRYWKLFFAMGLLPAAGGAAAIWLSVRKLKAR